MKKTAKQKMRDLLCEGLNQIIEKNLIDLSSTEDISGALKLNIFQKPSKVSWHGIGHGEVRVTVWWNIKEKCKDNESTTPLNKNFKEALDVCCSGWLERKDGLWLQGKKGNNLLDTYCCKEARNDLMLIPDVIPNGYNKEGKFYM